MKVKKYKHEGKTGDPKKKAYSKKKTAKKPSPAPEKLGRRFNVPGAPAPKKLTDRIGRRVMDRRVGFALAEDGRIPNPGLGTTKKKLKNSFIGEFERNVEGNPGGLKGRTKGKGGNVGKGIKPKRKLRR